VREIQSYVVRFYRRDAESFAGLVEDVQTARTAAFNTPAELCDVLSGRKAFRRRAARQIRRAEASPPALPPSR
jgi:hypothetical protein